MVSANETHTAAVTQLDESGGGTVEALGRPPRSVAPGSGAGTAELGGKPASVGSERELCRGGGVAEGVLLYTNEASHHQNAKKKCKKKMLYVAAMAATRPAMAGDISGRGVIDDGRAGVASSAELFGGGGSADELSSGSGGGMVRTLVGEADTVSVLGGSGGGSAPAGAAGSIVAPVGTGGGRAGLVMSSAGGNESGTE